MVHLGNGASMCALSEYKSIATTMGLTPIDGLPMGTRCGSLDPGVLLYLLSAGGLHPDELEQISTTSPACWACPESAATSGPCSPAPIPRAAEAFDLFMYRVSREIGSLAAAMGGLDALVLTGGIGEHAGPIRARICSEAQWLGLDFDERANAAGGPCISRPASRVSAWAVYTDEELMITLHTRRVLAVTVW